MEITICMPSYNRGSLALASIRAMQQTLEGVRYFVLDNASDEDTDGYDELAADDSVTFVRLAKNTGIAGAFSACLEHNKGVILYCSDEDTIAPDGLDALRALDWEKVAVARGGLDVTEGVENLDGYKNAAVYSESGSYAVARYCFQHPYMTGVAYNLDLIEPHLPLYHEHRWRYGAYMIFFLDVLACISGDAVTLDTPTGLLGAIAGNADDPERQALTPPYSFGSRVDQLAAYSDMLLRVSLETQDPGVYGDGYIKAFWWTTHCVAEVNDRQYDFYANLNVDTTMRIVRDVAISNIRAAVKDEGMRRAMIENVRGVYSKYHSKVHE